MEKEEIKEKKGLKKEVKKETKSKKNEELENLKVSYNELNDKFLRVAAELQNVRRRSDDEISKLRKYEGEDVLTRLLTIADDFERAINDSVNVSDEVSKYLEGFSMIYDSIKNILSYSNVLEIECIDKEFDPNNAYAVLTEAKEGVEAGIVIEVMQKGYTYNGKVIRPAMVKVSE